MKMPEINPDFVTSMQVRQEMLAKGIDHDRTDVVEINNEAYVRIMEMWPALRDLDFKGLKVLDVGCGSMFYRRPGSFQPWLARAFAKLGADVTGVDILPGVPDEPYTHIQMDLSQESLRDRFHPNSLDLVVSTSFFDDFSTGKDSVDDMRFERVIRDVYGILKPGKIFIPIYLAGIADQVQRREGFLRKTGFEFSIGEGIVYPTGATYFCRKPEKTE